MLRRAMCTAHGEPFQTSPSPIGVLPWTSTDHAAKDLNPFGPSGQGPNHLAQHLVGLLFRGHPATWQRKSSDFPNQDPLAIGTHRR